MNFDLRRGTAALVGLPAKLRHFRNKSLQFSFPFFFFQELGYIEVCVGNKQLACGDTGPGAMAELDNIVNAVMQELPGSHRVSHGPF